MAHLFINNQTAFNNIHTDITTRSTGVGAWKRISIPLFKMLNKYYNGTDVTNDNHGIFRRCKMQKRQ
jgi:hypothetical protein